MTLLHVMPPVDVGRRQVRACVFPFRGPYARDDGVLHTSRYRSADGLVAVEVFITLFGWCLDIEYGIWLGRR